MNRILTFLLGGLLLSSAIYGQAADRDIKVSSQDSILLNTFWTEFQTAVNAEDEIKLVSLCKFPFYCRPRIDDTSLKQDGNVTIKVTEKIFNDGQYKLFFARSIKDIIDQQEDNLSIFQRYTDNKGRPKGFSISYTIVAPSNNWEGLQGFIFLQKINKKYKITGIDTVP